MSCIYRALYRKWRPQKFGDIVGQEVITRALMSQINTGHIAHAYLFTGTRGTGKTSCAKVLAKAVNCENRQEAEPCGTCACCVGIEDGSILDVIEIDAASNNSVDDVRDLREETVYRPSRCAYRVYIIDEVHMLSASAFNALLKTLEEPPSHVIFILATTEIHKVPATILSRCQRFDFMRISVDVMGKRLLEIAENEEIGLTKEAAELLARLADGALRDAISLLDTCSALDRQVDEALVRKTAGIVDKDYLFSLSEAVAQGDTKEFLALVQLLYQQSIDVKRLTEELISHYRNYLLVLAQPDGNLLGSLSDAEREQYRKTYSAIGEAHCIRAIKTLIAALDRMGRASDPKIELEIALFDIALQGEEPSTAKAIETKRPVKPKPEPEAEKKPLEIIAEFSSWQDVVSEMEKTDELLYSYMKKAGAYTDGRRVLIDGGDMFLSYMREYEDAAEKIKSVIQKVTGKRYGIGPYKANEDPDQNKPTLEQTIQDWKEMGIPIEYVDESNKEEPS